MSRIIEDAPGPSPVIDALRAEIVRLRSYNEGLAKISADLERERDEARKENGQLRAAAILAFNEMCNTVAPRHTFTDAVDALDAVLYPNEQTAVTGPPDDYTRELESAAHKLFSGD